MRTSSFEIRQNVRKLLSCKLILRPLPTERFNFAKKEMDALILLDPLCPNRSSFGYIPPGGWDFWMPL